MGTAASVAALTPAALASRFAETHGGAAMTVVVVGDVDARRDRRGEARVRGDSARLAPPVAAASAPAPPARVTVHRAAPGRRREIVLGFRTAEARRQGGRRAGSAGRRARPRRGRAPAARARPQPPARRRRPSVQLPIARRRAWWRSRSRPRRAGSRRRPRRRWTCCCGPRSSRRPPTRSKPRAPRWRAISRGRGRGRWRARAGWASPPRSPRDSDDPRQLPGGHPDGSGPAELQEIAGEILNVDHLTLAVALPDGTPAGRDETAAALTPRLEAMVAAAPALADKHADRARARRRRRRRRPLRDARGRARARAQRRQRAAGLRAGGMGRSRRRARDRGSTRPRRVIAALLERGTRTRSAARRRGRAARRSAARSRGSSPPGRSGCAPTSCRGTSGAAWPWSPTAWRARHFRRTSWTAPSARR